MKAIALLSGGLDSTLAIRVILEQDIEVEAVNFFTPFCQCSRKSGCGGYEAKKVADRFGVKLKIFNIFGQEIRTLMNAEQKRGFYEIIWDGRNNQGLPAASGVYMNRLKAGYFVKTKKLILLR